jgi:hypothetical protein
VLRLFFAYRGGGVGPSHLPFAGGLAEQPAWLMAAFDHCSSVEAKHEAHMKTSGAEG